MALSETFSGIEQQNMRPVIREVPKNPVARAKAGGDETRAQRVDYLYVLDRDEVAVFEQEACCPRFLCGALV